MFLKFEFKTSVETIILISTVTDQSQDIKVAYFYQMINFLCIKLKDQEDE
jgi:hypothetical protein